MTDLAWGKAIKERDVEVRTLEHYCAEQGIGYIDVLKIDAEGFDFEVVKGAGALLRDGKIKLIYMEILFNDIYADITPFDVIFRSLLDLDYRLVSIYRVVQRKNIALCSEALFMHMKTEPHVPQSTPHGPQ